MPSRPDVDILERIRVAIVPSDATHATLTTHGMRDFESPELELVGVPMVLAFDAVRTLNHVADYILNRADPPVRVGQTMDMDVGVPLRFVAHRDAPDAPERWRLLPAEVVRCACCAGPATP